MARPAIRPAEAAPRWSVLLALTGLVLALHLLLLTDGLPIWWNNQAAPVPTTQGLSAPSEASTEVAAATLVPDAVLPVTSSTVRWIVLKPPAPEPPPPPAKKKKAPPAPPPEPVVEPEPAPEPPEEPAVAEARPEDSPVVSETPEVVATAEAPPPPVDVPPAPNAIPQAPSAPALPPPTAPGPRVSTAHLPADGQLDYQVKGQYKGLNYNASGELTWHFEAERYEAQSTVKAFLLGSRVHTSVGRVTPQGLAPERFGDRSRTEKAAHFDYEAKRIRYSRNSADAALLPGTQDQLSVSLQLALMLQAQPSAYVEGQALSLPVSNASYTEDWKFQIGPMTELELPAGTVTARLLTRSPRREFDKTLQVWLAPAVGYLPVRLRITEHNGDFVDQLLDTLPAMAQPTVQAQ
jgi:outer membrane biosynthesis protein TonB